MIMLPQMHGGPLVCEPLSETGRSIARRPFLTRFGTFIIMALLAVPPLWEVRCADGLQTNRPSPGDLKPGLESITTNDLLRHIRILSSDEFEGRATATKGEDLTVQYLVGEFRKSRLKPGNPDGTFIQKVPLVGITSEPAVSFHVGERRLDLALPGDCIATSHRFLPEVNLVDTEVVFVGYGVVASEYGWNDYKNIDVRGKTIVMLIGDPPIPDPKDPARLDDKMFKGRAMTYYGRWTYKYEIAAEKGAAAAIIVHETGPAGYPYFVLVASHGRENFELQSPDKNMGSVAVQGWLTLTKAKELFASAGHDFDRLKKAALGKDFKPVSIGAKASFTIKNTLREVNSQNVIAKLEGSDPRRQNEYVIYTAHWDHIGRNEKLEGDQIFNGALDNASGTAGLLELAQAFAQLKTPPNRTILFLAPTAEEKGLLGAKYYVEYPLYPLEHTLADINMDGINPWGRTRDLEIVGYGNSTLEDMLRQAAAAHGRVTTPDSESPKGRFFRSDHFEFAKRGVPGLYVKAGVDFIGKPAGFGKQKSDEYTERDYHKVTDEIKPDWDLSGGVDDLRLLFEVGYRVAQEDKHPEWKADSEFKARRSATPKSQARTSTP
jgi:Zn-dependent M28 family amino/carboxypeptidase